MHAIFLSVEQQTHTPTTTHTQTHTHTHTVVHNNSSNTLLEGVVAAAACVYECACVRVCGGGVCGELISLEIPWGTDEKCVRVCFHNTHKRAHIGSAPVLACAAHTYYHAFFT